MYLLALILVLLIFLLKTFLALPNGTGASNRNYPPRFSSLKCIYEVMTSKESVYRIYATWKQKYGDIFQLQILGRSIVIVNDLSVAKTYLNIPSCCGDKGLAFYHKIVALRRERASTGPGILIAQLPVAMEQRKFFMKTFSDLGKKTGSWKEQLNVEATALIEDLRSKDGKPFMIGKYFVPFFIKATWRALGNESLDPTLMQAVCEGLESQARISTLPDVFGLWFPTLMSKISASYRTKLDKIIRPCLLLNEEIERQSQSRIPDQPRHLMDAYLDQMDRTKDTSSSFHSSLSNMSGALADILIAALDTTSATFEWLMLHLVHNPQIQDKIQEEIQEVVGLNRLPTLEDRSKMPFTEACVLEILRLQPIATFAPPRQVTDDVEVNGYYLKKGSLITTNTVAINRNSEVWDRPHDFLPERFLCPETGQVLYEKRKFIHTFSNGLRVCPGQPIALDSLFVYLACLLQNFSVSASELPPFAAAFRVIVAPKHTVMISFVPRD